MDSFVIVALLLAADEILDFPFVIFNTTSTAINRPEIGLEIIVTLMVGCLLCAPVGFRAQLG